MTMEGQVISSQIPGGRIADEGQSPFIPWEPCDSLPVMSPNEVRYSRGFLAADPLICLPNFVDHWLSFFKQFGVELRLIAQRKHLAYPQDLHRITVIEANGEPTLIGLDEAAQNALLAACAPQLTEGTADIVLEYLERRCAGVLSKCWQSKESISFRYPSAGWAEEVEVIGAIELSLVLGGKPLTIWFGLGPRLTDELDAAWRAHLSSNPQRIGGLIQELHEDKIYRVGVDIAELAVQPALLIDYLRAGTVIDLEIPCDVSAKISLDGKPWARGKLVQINELFAVELGSFDVGVLRHHESSTRINVEIARTELDIGSLAEYQQPQAVLTISKPAKGLATLVINGESVATAQVGRLGANLALKILPR